MVVIGLILLLLAALLAIAAISSNTTHVHIDLWGLSISHVSVGGAFVAGMITTVAGVVGLILFLGGARRNRRLRKERRVLSRENKRLAGQNPPTDTGISFPSAGTTQYDERPDG